MYQKLILFVVIRCILMSSFFFKWDTNLTRNVHFITATFEIFIVMKVRTIYSWKINFKYFHFIHFILIYSRRYSQFWQTLWIMFLTKYSFNRFNLLNYEWSWISHFQRTIWIIYFPIHIKFRPNLLCGNYTCAQPGDFSTTGFSAGFCVHFCVPGRCICTTA